MRGKALNMAGGPRFASFMLQGEGERQAEGGPPPGPPGQPPLPPAPPLPARAVRFRGQVIGHVGPDGVFVRRVQARHVLRQPPAIALHREVLVELDKLSADVVAFIMDDGSTLTGPLSLYHGPRAIDIDRAGYGPQRAVLVADFAKLEIRPATADDVAAFMAAVIE